MKLFRLNLGIRGILAAAALLTATSCLQAQNQPFPDPPSAPPESQGLKKAVFAGGCFWGVEGVLESLKGVKSAVSGYCGGTIPHPSYEEVSTGTTGYAESVEVTYDPAVISYGTLLKVYFSIVADPTELNYQGPDEGTQYRSVLFYTQAYQKDLANAYIQKLSQARVWSSPIVTQVVPVKNFYPAEAYHQHFLRDHPDNPYIAAWDLPKLQALKQSYPNLISQ